MLRVCIFLEEVPLISTAFITVCIYFTNTLSQIFHFSVG
jgi:hypothetical protein